MDKNGTIDYVRQSRAFRLRDEKKKKEKKKIGDDPRARKIYKQGGRRLKRIPLTIVGGKLRGPTNDFKATRGGGGLDTGVGMERVSCVHHRDFLL